MCETEGLRLLGDDTLVNQVELGIRAGPGERPCVPDLIAQLEECYISARVHDNTAGIPTQHLRFAGRGSRAHPHLGVNWVHGNRPHRDQKLTAGGRRIGQVNVEQ